VVIGVPVATEPRAEIENLIGFFVNTLALRFDLSGQTRQWSQLLTAGQNADLAAQEASRSAVRTSL